MVYAALAFFARVVSKWDFVNAVLVVYLVKPWATDTSPPFGG